MNELTVIPNFSTFFDSPRGWVIAIGALIVLMIVLKIAGLIVRILALLVSIATLAWFFLRR